MCTMIATLAGLVSLTAVSAQAAPLASAKTIPVELGAGPSIELARQGCGWGWHRGHWLGLLALGSLLPELVTPFTTLRSPQWRGRQKPR
jgi:hypothetical protein